MGMEQQRDSVRKTYKYKLLPTPEQEGFPSCLLTLYPSHLSLKEDHSAK